MEWSGGCLCGAVRYRSDKAPIWAAHCHCGMCRKISGAPFMTFVEFPDKALQWTKRAPAKYDFPDGVSRGFCRECGSTLSYEPDDMLFVSLGSLDHPEQVRAECHCYTNTRLAWIKLADDLPQYPGPIGGKGGRPA